jgi:hypothetical protein
VRYATTCSSAEERVNRKLKGFRKRLASRLMGAIV